MELISKSVISATAACTIVSVTDSAAIPIGGGAILIGYILQGRDDEKSKFIGDVIFYTGISTVCLGVGKKLASNYQAAKKNDVYNGQIIWKVAECVIPKIASMIVSGTIISMTGLTAIPIGASLVGISYLVPGLASEILYSVGCDTFIGGVFSTATTKLIGHKAAKFIAHNKEKTFETKSLIGVGKITSSVQKFLKNYGKYFDTFNVLKKISNVIPFQNVEELQKIMKNGNDIFDALKKINMRL